MNGQTSSPIKGAVLLCAVTLAADVSAITLPSGFTEYPVATGLNSPTAMAFAPDGRLFVCEQGGSLRVIRNGSLLATPFLTVSVNSSGERGLLGVAFDPDFANNQYVYVYYTPSTPNLHRVSRFTASGDVAAGGESVIFTIPDASSASNHNGGALRFSRDGKLLIAVGERAQPSNAQSMTNLLGKVLRINTDGSIPTDNPFYGTATGNNRAIWALGLRNPFTFDVHPTSGRVFINDVGGGSWEEVNEGVAGANYGWPTTEGYTSDPRFRSPRYAYSHSEGCAIIGAAFYAPTTFHFPSSYTDTFFFADLCNNWIRNFDPTTNAVTTFATQTSGNPVDLEVGPDGNLYYAARSGGVVRRIAYTAGSAPVVTTPPASQTVALDDSVTFSVTVSGTGPFTYQWQRNGSDILGATSSSYTLGTATMLDSGARFRCRIGNSFGSVTSAEATLTVINNRRPQASIDTPAAGAFYNAGDTVAFAGSATDSEDGPLGASAFTWQVDFHHDTHTHPHVPATSGSTSGSFTVPVLGETSTNVWFRIHLSVVDSAGLVRNVYRDVHPRVARVTLATDPAGLTVNVDGGPAQTAPYAFDSVVGMTRSIGTATSQLLGGNSHVFVSWSDGGAATHNVTVPASPTTRTATFRAAPENDVAQVTSPTPGSTLTSSTVTFGWTAGTSVTQYWLSVGTTQGGSQIWGGSTGTSLSQSVSGLPTDGRTVYVRLQYFRNGAWRASYATYNGGSATPTPTPTVTPTPTATPVATSAPTPTPTMTPSSSIAQFTSPVPGSTLTSSTVTFAWTSGTGVSEYWLSIGTTQDGSQLWAGSTGTATSRTITGLPTDGRTIYARIQSLRGGVWQAGYATYATGSGPAPTPTPTPTPSSSIAQFTSPVPGSTLTSSTVTFSWSAGIGVSEYWLSIGTTPGGSQLWGGSTGTARSRTVSGLPIDGRTIYARIQSFTGGAWPASDATYATGGGGTPTPTPTSTPTGPPSDIAQITSPTPGGRLTSSAVTFTWSTGTGVSEYWLSVGTTADGSQIWGGSTGTATSRTISGLPTDGRTVYVRIQSNRNGSWPASYATYTTGP